jgi:hypothetical protein
VTSAEDQRLDRLFGELTAAERATMVLVSWKRGEEPDPQITYTLPDHQAREYTNLLRRLRALNGGPAHTAVVMAAEAKQLELHLALLCAVRLLSLDIEVLAGYIVFATNEPITISNHQARQAEERERMAPVGEFAALLTDRFGDWRPGDLEPGEDGEPEVRARAWDRVRREQARRLRALVAAGTLVGRGKGRTLAINAGSFFGWLGEEVPVYP